MTIAKAFGLDNATRRNKFKILNSKYERLNGCGCAARIGCVKRKAFFLRRNRKPVLSEVEGTIDETSCATE